MHFSSLNWIGAFALFLLLKLIFTVLWYFSSSEFGYFYIEYYCRTIAPSWLLDMLDKLQKRACSTVGPRLTASLKPSSYLRNVASLSLSHSYYFMFIWIGWICSTSILSWDVHLFFLIVYLISLSPFLNVIRLLFVNHFFLCLARLCMRNAFLWVMI